MQAIRCKALVPELAKMADGVRNVGHVKGPLCITIDDAAIIYKRYIGGNLKQLIKGYNTTGSKTAHARAATTEEKYSHAWRDRVVLLLEDVLNEGGDVDSEDAAGIVGALTIENFDDAYVKICHAPRIVTCSTIMQK